MTGLWDLETAKKKQSLPDRTCVCFAPDGSRLAVVTRAGHIKVLDGRTLELRAALAGHTESPD